MAKARNIDGEPLAAIECMDGRPGAAVRKRARRKHGINRVDSISAPGPVNQIADGIIPDWIKQRLGIARHHGARRVWIVAHDDCAGNPVDKRTQKQQVGSAVRTVRQEYPDMQVRGFWSRRKKSGKGWKLKRVK